MIPIFIGTDDRQGDAERVLEYSIRRNTDAEDLEFHYMRNGSHSLGDWGAHHPLGKWATGFSVFRMMVPWLTAEPFAIYLDSDMLVLGDIVELWNMRKDGKAVYTSRKRSEVMVMDTMAVHEALKLELGVTTMQSCRESTHKLVHYRQALAARGVADYSLPHAWNHLDSLHETTKLLHFTDMNTQPWEPWPEFIKYRKHRDPEAVELWETYNRESKTSMASGSSTPTART